MKKRLKLLGGLTTQEFLREYWQKRPLLIRGAVPGFKGLLTPAQLLKLACEEDVQARAVTYQRGRYELRHSPFTPSDFPATGRKKWTVLVQGVNHHRSDAADLLKQFSFIPHARMDDLMVSYATKGGGVGPHFDSYDVFLLQGTGHRRWQISTQSDRSLIDGAPLRILKDFRPEQEWVLQSGDMLYLPPHCAHNGVAEDDCMTYSVGFRTPAHQELAEQFLVYLQDRVEMKGMYADPGIGLQKHPSEISEAMLDQVVQVIQKIKWDRDDIANFLGCYLSEPKPHIFFDVPAPALAAGRFRQTAKTLGLALHLKSQMLCHKGWVFLNGEAHRLNRRDYALIRSFADERLLFPVPALSEASTQLLYQWYLDGYIVFSRNGKRP